MTNFNDFVNLFFNSDYFIVFLILITVILLIIIAYLIKLQLSSNEESNDTKTQELSEIKIEDSDDILSIESLDDDTEGVITKEETKRISRDLISEYEASEEENAIISTKELQNIKLERDKEFGEENNAKLIEQYEVEQENKAIISYEELLKNAKSLELKYVESENKQEEGSPIIKKVEIESKVLKGVSYAAEEEYLKILKEFRMSLSE